VSGTTCAASLAPVGSPSHQKYNEFIVRFSDTDSLLSTEVLIHGESANQVFDSDMVGDDLFYVQVRRIRRHEIFASAVGGVMTVVMPPPKFSNFRVESPWHDSRIQRESELT